LLLICHVVANVFALVNSIILARALGVDRLGEYAYAMGLTGLFGLLPNFGINAIVTRIIARQPSAAFRVLKAALRAQALLAGIVLIAIPAFSASLPNQPVPIIYIGLAALHLAVGTMNWPYLAVLAGHLRYDRVAAIELFASFAGLVTVLVAVALHGGVGAVLSAHIVAAGSTMLVARKVTQPFLEADGGEPPMGITTLLRQAAPFGAVAAVQGLYTKVDFLLLGQMASMVALGLYSVAYKPTNILVGLGSTIAVTLFPLMVQAPKLTAPASFQRVVRGLAAAGPAMALVLSGLAGPLLHAFYGSEYVDAAPILIVLAWSVAVNWLYAPLSITLQARGCERWWLMCLIGGVLLNVAGNLWAIPRWGALGAAAATLASEVVLLLLGTVLVCRELDKLPPLKPVAVGLGASIAGGVALWLSQEEGTWLATVVALIVYGGVLVVFRVVNAADAAMLISWVREVVPKRPHG
jgi:O-antigen/teichoic acid export membrane protein